MSTNTDHTPTPWLDDHGAAIYTADGKTRLILADRDEPNTRPTERDSNIHFIVKACNMHESLVAIVEHLYHGYNPDKYGFTRDSDIGQDNKLADMVNAAHAAITEKEN